MTPQQEIEPLRTDFEDYMRSILKGDALAHDSGTLGYYCRETHNMWCAYQAAWNRRAPSPTEPAVDRDARNAQRAIADIRRFVNESSDKNLGMWIDDDIDTLTTYLATPASPAVPGDPLIWHALTANAFVSYEEYSVYRREIEGLTRRANTVQAVPEPAPPAPGEWKYQYRIEPQVAQASKPTSAGEFPGVNIDRAHGIMAGYNPKPPPPRPQRPPGPLWTDAERERFRENMKRGERCPICSVIEGGQHFPGCSRGVP